MRKVGREVKAQVVEAGKAVKREEKAMEVEVVLKIIGGFLNEFSDSRARVYYDGHLVMVHRDHHGYTLVRVYPERIVIEEDWNSWDYWDGWVINLQERVIRYIGSMDEPRQLPLWAAGALEGFRREVEVEG